VDLERRLEPGPGAPAGSVHQGPLIPWLETLCARPLAALAAPSVAPLEPLPEPAFVSTRGLTVPTTGEVLSPREVEVLRLIIAGASNQAIAETLVISPHTAKHHVASILAKLGAPTRTAAAVQGRALGLEPLVRQ
jgi:DNA-binding NarL/FixJ family response regulator